jgi:hypothetical protein
VPRWQFMTQAINSHEHTPKTSRYGWQPSPHAFIDPRAARCKTTGALRRALGHMALNLRSRFRDCLHAPRHQQHPRSAKKTECNEHAATVTREVGCQHAGFALTITSDPGTSEIKCSGGLPRCNYCEKTDKPCIYERPRKDRLVTSVLRANCLIATFDMNLGPTTATNTLYLSSKTSACAWATRTGEGSTMRFKM